MYRLVLDSIEVRLKCYCICFILCSATDTAVLKRLLFGKLYREPLRCASVLLVRLL